MSKRKDIQKEMELLNNAKQLICMADNGKELVFYKDVILPQMIVKNVEHNTELLARLSHIKIDNPQGLLFPKAGKYIAAEKSALLKVIGKIEYELYKKQHSGWKYVLVIIGIVLFVLAILTAIAYFNKTTSISGFIIDCVNSVLCGLLTHFVIRIIDRIKASNHKN